ncbi:hypothetical protein JHS3_04260 [Jeongeupia sp. HS-3]|uniref:hypothetical protein n=1 Tax=Jeongeupia sp. HS-3 TaxID=1009682 RepID=UPI0018A5090F|nr:hypothetical protein [Jeongeupia sp. HS-3]BCL74690.1 hypothetical protein JHS3_04260 [Jeongeupia sp. HS-3]
MKQPTQRDISLAPAQTQQFVVARGTVIHVVRGRLAVIEAPLWLAETMLPRQRPLRAGEHHVFTQADVVTLQTDAGAQLRCTAASSVQPAHLEPTWLPAVLAWLGRRNTAP